MHIYQRKNLEYLKKFIKTLKSKQVDADILIRRQDKESDEKCYPADVHLRMNTSYAAENLRCAMS